MFARLVNDIVRLACIFLLALNMGMRAALKTNKRFHACRHVADSQVWAVGLVLSTKGSSSLDSAGEA